MIGNSVADAKRMFKHACAFSGCARFCYREPWDIEHRLPDYSIAGIVNSAFACEVFLKSLLVYHGMEIKDIVDDKHRGVHQLADLWKILEKKDRACTSLILQKCEEHFKLSTPDKFNELLDNVSNAFVFWRYIYEKNQGTIHVAFLNYFRELLKEVCCEKYYGMTWSKFTKGAE